MPNTNEFSERTPFANQESPPREKLQMPPKSEVERPIHERIPHAGFLLSTLVGLFDSLFPLGVKKLRTYDAILLNFYDYISISVCSTIVLLYRKEHPFPEGYRLLLLADGGISCIGLLTMFVAYKLLPIGDASVIVASTPIVILILARILLKEKFDCGHVFLIFLATVGLVCISQPTFLFGHTRHHLSVAGLAAAFASLFGFACAGIARRQLREVHVAVVTFVYCTISAAVALTYTLARGNFKFPHTYREVLYLVLINIAHSLSLTLDIVALKWENAGIVAIGRLTNIVFSYIWQVIIFNKPPGMLSIIGGIIVLTAVILMGVKKVFEAKESKSH